jgi:hypothetical protein
VSDVSDDPDGIFACRVQRPLSTKHPEFALSVAVVDTRNLAGMRNHCEGSVLSPLEVGSMKTLKKNVKKIPIK